jgi:superfamily I DNA/RNA helicase
MGEAVAFPNIVLDDTLPGLDKPSELILDLHDVDDISKWVQRAFKYHRGKRPVKDTAPGRQAIQKLSKQLVGDGPVLLLVPKWDTMTSETGKLLELTEQQYNILDGFAQHTRVAVSGCAGSGKTMLAFHKATQLAEQGQRVLLTCFNKNLADDLRVRAGDMPNLDIAHFHRVAVGMMNQAGIECHDKRDATFFRETIPGLMLDALDQLPEHRYDAIIVDEAQDFEDSWWEPIQFLLRDMEQSILYIFYDSNQNIFVEQSNFPIQQPPYLLTTNCRNTQYIHQQVLAFYTGSPLPKLRGPQGWPVEVIDIGNPQQLQRQLLKKLNDLVSEDGSKIPTDEIVVLTPFAKEKSHLWGKAASSKVTLTDKLPVSPGKVYCTTIQSFKGLEASVVVLAEFERWSHGLEDIKRLLYIASSRARNHLIVFLTDDASDDVRALFTGESS